MQAWLTKHNIAWSNDMLKVELLELCRTHRPLPTYFVDETLKQHEHRDCDPVAPYYAELNSNELIWAMLKGKVARSNLTFKKDTATATDCDDGSTDDKRTPTASEGHEAS